MMKILVVVEQTATGYAASAPDIPGCIATGDTKALVESTIRDALQFHLEGMRAEGLPVPKPHSYATVVEVAA
jgi:predicted RNase H-like HicB family nuclease